MNPGDGLLIVAVSDSDQVPLAFKTVTEIKPDPISKTSTVTLLSDNQRINNNPSQTSSSNYFFPTKVIKPIYQVKTEQELNSVNQIDYVTSQTIFPTTEKYNQLRTFAAEHLWSPKAFVKAINFVAQSLIQKPSTVVYAFRVHAGFFGNNVPPFNTSPWSTLSNLNGNPYSKVGTTDVLTSWEDTKINYNSFQQLNDDGTVVYLDNHYPKVLKNSWIVLKKKGVTSAYTIGSVFETTRADFAIAAKVTGLSLNADSDSLTAFKFRETTAYIQSDELALAEIADSTPIDGTQSLILNKSVDGLQIGQLISITGELVNQPDHIVSEVVTLTDIEVTPVENGGLFTQITFEALQNKYLPETVSINANIAEATHGETQNEVLGSGDPTQPYLEFVLKKNPLTYIPASTSDGIASTLQIQVDNIIWNEVGSLYNVKSKDHSFITRIDDSGQTHVLFGNSRPAAGSENITAKYRSGIGSVGTVQAGQLSILMTRPLGVQSVTNPVDSSEGVDPENGDQAQRTLQFEFLLLIVLYL